MSAVRGGRGRVVGAGHWAGHWGTRVVQSGAGGRATGRGGGAGEGGGRAGGGCGLPTLDGVPLYPDPGWSRVSLLGLRGLAAQLLLGHHSHSLCGGGKS